MRKRDINDEVCKVDKYDVPEEEICLFKSCYPECNKYGGLETTDNPRITFL